ncbi:hypothetical protein BGX38DRAFT_511387 [Terfezia claveryi]|nr:hypothetical protein BGX38DRAFT_511387 [Terfezia claveryi]
MHAAHDTHRQNSEKRISMYSGLSKVESSLLTLHCIIVLICRKTEMESWWRANAARLPLDFNEADKETMETLTGRVPIFLHALLAIGVNQVDQAGNSSSPVGEEDLSACTATEIYTGKVQDAFWQSAELMSAIGDFIDFTVVQCRALRDTDDLLMYTSIVSIFRRNLNLTHFKGFGGLFQLVLPGVP